MRRISTVAGIVFVSLFATACTSLEPALSTEPTPEYSLVDPAMTDMTKYAVDYRDCVRLANQNHSDVSDTVTGVARTAANKASFGLVGSSKSSEVERGAVLRKCLTGRGYNVLR